MPVTAGPVPGATSELRRVSMDPGRFRNGRWFLLAEGVLVSAFGIAGLVTASMHPHAGPTGTPVLGLASTRAHSGMMLTFGVAAIAGVGHRRAAITVTALSAAAYAMLLFLSAVATARSTPTPLGLHAADIVLHGVLAVVNLALLMWLIPDELGDLTWVPRRRGERGSDQQQPLASEAVTEPAVRARESGAHASPTQNPVARSQSSPPVSTDLPVNVGSAHRAQVENSTQATHLAARATNAVTSRGGVVAVAVLAAALALVIWIRRH